jgi:hypothetical protein
MFSSVRVERFAARWAVLPDAGVEESPGCLFASLGAF